MVWVVVQWVGENSVSVINEKESSEEADLIKEGATVSVISKNSKGKAQIYQVHDTFYYSGVYASS